MIFQFIQKIIFKQWYHKLTYFQLLLPLEYLFILIIKARKNIYKKTWKEDNNIPVWIVGDITIGGSGKSPFIIWIARMLEQRSIKAVIINHAYKSNLDIDAGICNNNSSAQVFGDEAVMLAKQTKLPIVVAKSRIKALKYINENLKETRLIIFDDGLQHYKVARDKEFIILNKKRLGNKHCFPVGPLREPLPRLNDVDVIITHNESSSSDMKIVPTAITNISTGKKHGLIDLPWFDIHAVAAIADPDRFYKVLEKYGFNIIRHPFRDHHDFTEKDLAFADNLPIVMTTKDAVKCQDYAQDNLYQLDFDVIVAEEVELEINKLLAEINF
ncbi:MAG: tetraacyldisaccharide 4'-kinase [Legionellales bacterium]|jgi:tetraacyldisaccharide 4'-kinase|nr:tetraacyldisaccharide 4'-kinase [Legionellales bacterium]